ncbi:MAG: hypothetical protein Q9M91_03455 [Candidatus Dojkabacteria bacterium]|nr:hypothetical protein [Candidatus Dojkabacteria bacterium]MDQ7020879.1 hypothetical protein [Candidatus Dojkabacteria bacterium]
MTLKLLEKNIAFSVLPIETVREFDSDQIKVVDISITREMVLVKRHGAYIPKKVEKFITELKESIR